MAFRRRTSVRRVGTRKRAVWINIPFGGISFSETVNTQQLVVPEDWEAQFSGNSNETAVLRAVVGQFVWQQTVVGTAGGQGYWGIYIADKDATVVPTFSVAGMADVDWLRTGCRPTASAVTDSKGACTWSAVEPIEIRAKRRMKSRDAIYLAAQFGTDAASPAGLFSGLLRFLVARD